MNISDLPHSPLPSRGQWPQSYLDDIHLFLANVGGRSAYDNAIINGDFDIDQRISPGGAPGTTLYTTDRWRTAMGAGCAINAQRFLLGSGTNYPSVGLPYQARSFLNVLVSAAPLTSQLSQRIESVNTLAGQTCTVSFFAKWSGAAYPLAVSMVQNFGSGAGAAAPVTTAVTTFNLPAAGANYVRYSFTFVLPSIVGKAIRTPLNAYDDYLELIFTLPAALLGTLNLTGVDLRASASPVTYVPTAPDLTLERCRRFYQKSYPLFMLPGTITLKGAIVGRAGAAAVALAMPGAFIAPLRAQPTVTLYSPITGAANNVSNLTGAVDIGVVSTDPSETTWGIITLAGAPAAVDMLRMQWTAEAEL